MNQDFRIKVGFPTHRKTLALQNRLRADGVLALIALWDHAATQHWNGVLAGYTPALLARVSGWPGNPDDFADALLDIAFLDRLEGGGYLVHNWLKHNAYCAQVENRIKKGKKAAETRWNPSDAQDIAGSNAPCNANGIMPPTRPDPSQFSSRIEEPLAIDCDENDLQKHMRVRV